MPIFCTFQLSHTTTFDLAGLKILGKRHPSTNWLRNRMERISALTYLPHPIISARLKSEILPGDRTRAARLRVTCGNDKTNEHVGDSPADVAESLLVLVDAQQTEFVPFARAHTNLDHVQLCWRRALHIEH